MDSIKEHQLNQAAYRQMSGFIQATYPSGRYLAISGGKIVADATSFEELDCALRGMGASSAEVLVVQAGVAYPEYAVIFAQ